MKLVLYLITTWSNDKGIKRQNVLFSTGDGDFLEPHFLYDCIVNFLSSDFPSIFFSLSLSSIRLSPESKFDLIPLVKSDFQPDEVMISSTYNTRIIYCARLHYPYFVIWYYLFGLHSLFSSSMRRHKNWKWEICFFLLRSYFVQTKPKCPKERKARVEEK